MILHSLSELYDRLNKDPGYEIAPFGYAPQKIGFKVILKPDGSLFDIQEVNDPIKKEKFLYYDCPEHKVRSGTKILPQFICDNAKYMLGFNDKLTDFDKSEALRIAYKDVHTSIEIKSDKYKSFQKFISSWNPEPLHTAGKIIEASKKLLNAEDTIPIQNEIDDLKKQLQESEKWQSWFSILFKQKSFFGIVEIQGGLPIHYDSFVKDIWSTKSNEELNNLPSGQCLISGEIGNVIDTTHPKIKGFESATSLVGVQKNSSYESYEQQQGLSSPISGLEAFKYATALSWMLNGKGRSKHRLSIADTSCIFWTSVKTDTEDLISELFKHQNKKKEEAMDTDTISNLTLYLNAIRSGYLTDIPERDLVAEFYILGIEQPNPGRFSIRFFHQSSIKELIKSFSKHYNNISIIKEFENQYDLPSKHSLLNETAQVTSSGKKLYDTIPPLLGGALMRSILEGTKYPEVLYSAILRRIRADRTINYLRACIIKGTLTRNHQLQIPIMLDPEHPETAYHLGRLFTLLEKAQTDALGDINAGIRDKYYSSASSTPASVYPKMLRTYQHHLAKIPTGKLAEKIGAEKAKNVQGFIDKLTQDIINKIPATGFPAQLNLKQQGIFAIGYYHQRKDLFTKKDTTEQN